MTNSEGKPAAAASPAAASFSGVSKLFGSFAALRKVSLDFLPGSSTMILGDNGAGKSTLLRLTAGLIAASRGTVLTFGQDPRRERQRIAYMSHEPMLYDELSALENLRYFASLHHRCDADGSCPCAASPEKALRAVGLDPALTRPVGQYSQGMRQRASLARVLQVDPELLLLDEPPAYCRSTPNFSSWTSRSRIWTSSPRDTWSSSCATSAPGRLRAPQTERAAGPSSSPRTRRTWPSRSPKLSLR